MHPMESNKLLKVTALALGTFITLFSPAPAAVYPKNNPAGEFAAMKVYDNANRPWRTAKEDWDGARARIVADSAWADWLEAERAEVTAWMENHRDRVEWVAGWSNDFVSPRDGSRLTYTDAIPGVEIDHFSSPSDARVEITPKLKAAWVRLWREKHAGMMERAARLYRLTGNAFFREWAAGQMDFYANNYLQWEPQRQGARLYWQVLTEGVNLITYAHTVRLLDTYVTAERRQHWYENFFRPEVEVVNAGFPQILNITCWLRSASAQVGLIFGDEAMWRDAIDGPWGVRQQIAEGITSDYLWFEQSFSYNNYVTEALASLFTTAGLYGRSAELADDMATAQNLMLAPYYLRFPDGQLPNPSDQKGLLYVPDREFLASVYRIFPTVLGLTEAMSLRNWNTLLDPPPAPPAEAAALPSVESRMFESSRMAVLRSGEWQLYLHFGQPPVKSHLQEEVLNFSAFHGGTDITHDPGTVGYGSPMHTEYFLRGLNHNVPLINGEGQEQPPKGRRPDTTALTRAGELVEFSPENATVTARHRVYRSDTTAQRTLALRDGKLIDVVRLESRAGEPQLLGIALHLQGAVQVPADFASNPKFAEGRPESFGYWQDVHTATFRDKTSLDVRFGEKVMRVTFETTGDFTLSHGTSPDVPPARRDALYLELSGTSATFTTTIEPVAR